MAMHQSLLFNWENVNSLPAETFLEKFEQARGHGRNEYPVRPMWRLSTSARQTVRLTSDPHRSASGSGARLHLTNSRNSVQKTRHRDPNSRSFPKNGRQPFRPKRK